MTEDIFPLLERIACALERQAPSQDTPAPDWSHSAYVWQPAQNTLKPVTQYSTLPTDLLVGLEDHIETLRQNTGQFTAGYPANNVLLWGARGMGKSSVVKAVHREYADKLKLIEIHREDIATLPALLGILRGAPKQRFLLFGDDLSFDDSDTSYKSLKTVLEGGVEGKPENVILYATSNRRHLLPRQMIENERQSAIHPTEATEEKVSLSDRFGLWLGFYPCTQDQYLEMVENYAKDLKIKIKKETLRAQAIEWAATRGARSGRVAWQFSQDLAGRHKKKAL